MLPFTRPLQKGDTGEDVLALQEKLKEIGFSNCLLANNNVGTINADGNFGPITEGCLESFQAKVLDAVTTIYVPQAIKDEYPFTTNGIMDFANWYILSNYEKLSEYYQTELQKDPLPEIEIPPIIEDTPINEKIIKKMLEISISQIGVVESGGNNYGQMVQEYQKIGSDGEVRGGQPWCQYFQNWILVKACQELGLDYKWTYSGYTPDCVNLGVRENIGTKNCTWDDIQVGDFGYVYSASRGNAKHVFLIVAKDDNTKTLTTIEGNTNPGGGSDGYGVFKRKRTKAQCWAIVRVANLYL